jgi:NADH-quinone oxidoreductase subunit C
MHNAATVEELKKQFEGAIVNEISFMGETTLETDKKNLKEILKSLKYKHGYRVLMDLTGVDYLEPTKRTKVLYWLHHPTNLERLRVVVFVEREGALPSVVDLWRGADWYERELFDLFGINFEGHPSMKRILMPDDWEGHPLRRDYALTEEPVEFKHGVKPKIPSQIIPNVKGPKQFNPLGTYVRSPEKH